MLFSSLIIHLSGGRVESHFHIFGSLAFLASYRDWRVIAVATVITATDHLARGFFWPSSLFGVDQISLWRPFEHAAWVLFEDFVVVITIMQNRSETYALAEQEVLARESQQDVLRSEFDKLRGAITAAADGDFTVEIESSNVTETELLSSDIRRMFTDLRQTIGTIGRSTEEVRQRADRLVVGTGEIRDAVESQRTSSDRLARRHRHCNRLSTTSRRHLI